MEPAGVLVCELGEMRACRGGAGVALCSLYNNGIGPRAGVPVCGKGVWACELGCLCACGATCVVVYACGVVWRCAA